MTYADFSRIALYASSVGYYRANRTRVGKRFDADFYTSTSVGPVFGRLLAAAARRLIEPRNTSEFALAEIGPEPGDGIFADIPSDFGDCPAFPLGQALKLDRPTVLVANEILDAQPFHRLIFRAGKWRELGVEHREEGLREVERDEVSEPVNRYLSESLPQQTSPGYHLDISLEAEVLLNRWIADDRVRAVILIDYGKSWPELIEATPQGTARAYRRHRQSNHLLAHPGEQDLTTHVCWDRLLNVLQKAGFTNPIVVRQEAFFVEHAWAEIERICNGDGDGNHQPDLRRQLQTLLHPGGFGSRFQVLCAKR